MTYFTYILLCSDNTYYIGKTNNLQKRLRQHNGELKGGARYTSGRRPVSIIHFEQYLTLSEALQRERELKKLTRQEKMQLIRTHGKTLV